MDELPVIDEGSVVVGVDDSDNARRALEWAAAEARLRDVPLVAVMAWEYPLSGLGVAPADADPVDPVALVRERLAAVVDSAIGADHGVTVRLEPVFGPPGKVLVGLGARASMLVIGRRGRGGISRFTLGSAADHVTKHAECPVVILH